MSYYEFIPVSDDVLHEIIHLKQMFGTCLIQIVPLLEQYEMNSYVSYLNFFCEYKLRLKFDTNCMGKLDVI